MLQSQRSDACLQDGDPDLALESCEFWSAFCEARLSPELLQPHLQTLIPVLLKNMVYEEDDEEVGQGGAHCCLLRLCCGMKGPQHLQVWRGVGQGCMQLLLVGICRSKQSCQSCNSSRHLSCPVPQGSMQMRDACLKACLPGLKFCSGLVSELSSIGRWPPHTCGTARQYRAAAYGCRCWMQRQQSSQPPATAALAMMISTSSPSTTSER